MSKKCPHCGSYNSESIVSGNIGYGLVQGARYISAGAAYVAVGLFNHGAAHAAGHSVLHGTEDWGDDIDRHHCCNCGRDFK